MTDEGQQRDGFDFLHGSWTVRHQRLRERLNGCADWEQTASRAECRPILGGAGNIDEIDLPSAVIGSTLRLYDPAADHWTLHWSTSASGRLDPPMTGRFTGGVGTFLGDNEHQGRTVRVRFVWDAITPDAARWTQSFAPAGTEEWEVNWVMEFARAQAL